MKDLFDKAIESLIRKEDNNLFGEFISGYSSREERHYCAYLFAWLINEPGAIELFFKNHFIVPEKPNSITTTNIPDFSSTDFKTAKIYYEYTALRELLDLVGRKIQRTDITDYKGMLKAKIETEIFKIKQRDIQKKKPDLVFYFSDSKILVLVEAKFEMRFDEAQVKESKKYGEILQTLFPNDIRSVYVTALGLNYYLQKIKEPCLSISWEKIFELLPKGLVKEEIKRGLDYQKLIHPQAMVTWQKL